MVRTSYGRGITVLSDISSVVVLDKQVHINAWLVKGCIQRGIQSEAMNVLLEVKLTDCSIRVFQPS